MFNQWYQVPSPACGQPFAVCEPLLLKTAGVGSLQHNSPSKDGAKQAAPSHFIHPGDTAVAGDGINQERLRPKTDAGDGGVPRIPFLQLWPQAHQRRQPAWAQALAAPHPAPMAELPRAE